MTAEPTPSKAAYKLTHILNTVATAHGTPRFPVDVVSLAKESARCFGWKDPITRVEAADIQGFEGALSADSDRRQWILLYNSNLKSPGRIRFTQAHELGHYLLHRMRQDSFNCSISDTLDRTDEIAAMEAQANEFASTLLMPLDDFRDHVSDQVDFEILGACADRYGVSLTAATLRWIKHTEASAVLLMHNDGFIKWAVPSAAALKRGAYFKTRSQVIPVPASSIAADPDVEHERIGRTEDARVWFPHAEDDFSLRELKMTADQYDFVMTLLVLPRSASCWKARESEDQ